MGASSVDVETVRDAHVGNNGVEVRYRVRLTLAGQDVAPPSPWYNASLQLRLVGAPNPAEVMKARHDLRAWLDALPDLLAALVCSLAWAKDDTRCDPSENPGPP